MVEALSLPSDPAHYTIHDPHTGSNHAISYCNVGHIAVESCRKRCVLKETEQTKRVRTMSMITK